MRNRHSAAIIAGLLLITGLSASASPASAVVHCEGAACEGLNLADTDCHVQAFEITGVTAVDETSARLGSAAVWYSPTCHAMWAIFTITDDSFVTEGVLQTQPEYGGVNESPFSETVYKNNGATSPLVDFQQSVRACIGNGRWCTTWR
jgi:hypothetical protein